MKFKVFALACGVTVLFGGIASAADSSSVLVSDVQVKQTDSPALSPSDVNPKMVSVKVQFYTMTRKAARKQKINLPKQADKTIVLADAEAVKKFQDQLAKADAKNVNTPVISTISGEAAKLTIKTDPVDESSVAITPKVNEDNTIATTVEVQFDSTVTSGQIEQTMKFGEPIAILPYAKGKTVYAALVTLTLIENHPKEDIQ